MTATAPKVLFVSTQMEAAGVQGVATAMLRALLAEGTDASLTFLYTKRPVFEGLPGVSSLSGTKPRNPLGLLRIFVRLIRHVRRTRPTAIIGFAHYASPLSALAGWLCGVPTRVASQTSTPSTQGRLPRLLDWLCGSLGIYTANIAVSTTIENMFAHYPATYRARLRTIFNGVTMPPPRLDKAGSRVAFGLPEAFTVVSCGRLSRSKNQAFLLRVVERLPDVHLAILGEGELRHDLEREIAERDLRGQVSLLGEVPASEVREFLNCGDVFAFPSLHEGQGVAVIEAMQAGLPVIVSDNPAVVATVGDAGPAIPVNDPGKWVEAIEHLRSRPAARNEAGRRSIQQGGAFTFEKMLEEYRLLWEPAHPPQEPSLLPAGSTEPSR